MEWYIGTEWKLERKGLHKEVLALQFTKLEKPHLVSTVLIKVENVHNLNERESKYLSADQIGQQQQLEMGTALTPVDYYVELLVRQMMVGEQALCTIRTSSSSNETADHLSFTVTLQKILLSKEIHKLQVSEMYELAQRYKECGVNMFKRYPIFAHEYFVRASKCLISYMPFESLTTHSDGVAGDDMQTLFVQIQTNLAACLLQSKRYEDVIYQTNFVNGMTHPTDKSLYRRALAYYHMKEFEAAQEAIERVPKHEEKKEFVQLMQRINDSRKVSDDQYKHLVQRMFS